MRTPSYPSSPTSRAETTFNSSTSPLVPSAQSTAACRRLAGGPDAALTQVPGAPVAADLTRGPQCNDWMEWDRIPMGRAQQFEQPPERDPGFGLHASGAQDPHCDRLLLGLAEEGRLAHPWLAHDSEHTTMASAGSGEQLGNRRCLLVTAVDHEGPSVR